MKNPTVLVVDDEELLCDAIAMELEFSGIKTFKSTNGDDAWDIYQKHHEIDLIITDVRMPHGDGVSLLDKIREKNKTIPVVVFITAHKDITDEAAYDKGVNGILTKPFKPDQLVNEVKKFLS